MIRFENTKITGFAAAFRGMRNPMNSWDKSDGYYNWENSAGSYRAGEFHPGKKDLELAQRLIKAGSDHRKFLRYITVTVDITAPLYWWKEFDTYKVGTVANSCSTMHKIHSKPFTLTDFSLDGGVNAADAHNYFKAIVQGLEMLRTSYNKTKDKAYWRALIQALPESYNQKRTILLNYEVLRNIYKSRQNHKLEEWSKGFMMWIDALDYADELIKL